MASTEILTTTESRAVNHSRSLAKAGNRLYWAGGDGTNLVYKYSDDDGATWVGTTTIHADEFRVASLSYDAVNGRLNICYGGANQNLIPLCFRAITSNVASGTPGALTTETVIDVGGAGLGVTYAHLIHSATGTNPRYWIIGQKQTGAGGATAIETRAWFVNAGSAADTAGNWANPALFQNLGANSDGFGRHLGLGVYWTGTTGLADRVTFVFNTTGGTMESVTFDPTATTPDPGTVTVVTTGIGSADWTGQTMSMALNAKADYLVMGVIDNDDAMWDFFKTVNGTVWAAPDPGWTNITMGRGSLARSGADFYVVGSSAYGDLATTVQPLVYRKITTSGDVMGSQAAFSDTNGQGVTTPLDTGTSLLYAAYRGSTASPYSVRSDSAVLTAQILRPDADVTTTGWTTAPLWSKLDEAVAAGDVVTATAS